MKKQLFKYLLAMFMFIGAAVTSQAQTRIYVKVRPTEIVTTRTVAPHPNYVWVDEEWTVKWRLCACAGLLGCSTYRLCLGSRPLGNRSKR